MTSSSSYFTGCTQHHGILMDVASVKGVLHTYKSSVTVFDKEGLEEEEIIRRIPRAKCLFKFKITTRK